VSVASADSAGAAPIAGDARSRLYDRRGFAIGAAGVALFVIGSLLPPSFASRYGLWALFRVVPGPLGEALMLYGTALVVLIVCIGGMAVRPERRTAWALGLTAAALVWISHEGGWMVASIDGAPFFWFLNHPAGYQLMTAGALVAIAGGLLALRDGSRADAGARESVVLQTGRRRPRLAIAGFGLGVVAVGLDVAGTLLPYETFLSPPSFGVVGQSVYRHEVRSIGFVPMTLVLAAMLALFGTALVVLLVCVAGLVARDASRWTVAFLSVAAIWGIRLLGERLSEQILLLWGHGRGWWLMAFAPTLAIAGGLLASSGVHRARHEETDGFRP
jgi:hypothetical protein